MNKPEPKREPGWYKVKYKEDSLPPGWQVGQLRLDRKVWLVATSTWFSESDFDWGDRIEMDGE